MNETGERIPNPPAWVWVVTGIIVLACIIFDGGIYW